MQLGSQETQLPLDDGRVSLAWKWLDRCRNLTPIFVHDGNTDDTKNYYQQHECCLSIQNTFNNTSQVILTTNGQSFSR